MWSLGLLRRQWEPLSGECHTQICIGRVLRRRHGECPGGMTGSWRPPKRLLDNPEVPVSGGDRHDVGWSSLGQRCPRARAHFQTGVSLPTVRPDPLRAGDTEAAPPSPAKSCFGERTVSAELNARLARPSIYILAKVPVFGPGTNTHRPEL